MNDIDRQYRNLLREILGKGVEDVNRRTGAKVLALSGRTLQVDLEKEFPLISLRPIPAKVFVAETCFYLMGTDDPAWLQQYTSIWDPFLVNGRFPASYGTRWRRSFGRDQIDELVTLLKKDPTSRHGFVAIWDPRDDGLMAAPKPNVPCPVSFTAQVVGGRLDMCVTVRSQDCYLGLPTDVAGFALLQLMLADAVGVRPGMYTHFIANAHLYENQWLNARVLSERVWSKQKAKPVRVPPGSLGKAKYGERGLVEAIVKEVEDGRKPLPKLPKVDIMV